jgi:hypothetical protein
LVTLVGYGLRESFVNSSTPFQLCLPNSTIFVFRSPSDHQLLRARHLSPHHTTDYTFKRTIHHFSFTNDCLVLESNSTELIHEWILPISLCPHLNIVNVYGYSYGYSLRFSASSVVCLFFSTFSASHHITFESANPNSTFESEFYTPDSLSQRTFAKRVVTSRSTAFSSADPFLVRLTTASRAIKTVYVATTTLHLPVLYANCRAEEIDALEDVPSDGSRARAADVSNETCTNPIDAIALLFVYAALVVGLAFVGWRWVAVRFSGRDVLETLAREAVLNGGDSI